MTDLEITKLCEEAMGLVLYTLEGSAGPVPQQCGDASWYCCNNSERGYFCYNPLHDDAQAMALVKKFGIETWCSKQEDILWYAKPRAVSVSKWLEGAEPIADLNRAICECVAKMQAAKVAA